VAVARRTLESRRLDLRHRSRRVLGLFGYADDLSLSSIEELKMKFPIQGVALTCRSMGDACLHSPLESFFTKKWRPSEVELVK
jgi:hypothetical protein